MEKYRRWTDQRAGINPFVEPKRDAAPLVGQVLQLVAILIKGPLFMAYLPLFVLLSLVPIPLVRQQAARLMLFLFGVYSIEDFALQKSERHGKCTRILSNHTCFIDIVYYLYRYPGYQFAGFSEDEDQNATYFVISPLKAFFSGLTNLQPFYKINSGKHCNFKELIKAQYKGDSRDAKLIIFYQKIRTNGKGTIRISKSLSDDLFDLGEDSLVVQIKYGERRNSLFSLTSSGLWVVLAALGTSVTGNNMKIKASKQNAKDIHSSSELRESVSMMASGPLLETEPRSYFQFLQFFSKTQTEYKGS